MAHRVLILGGTTEARQLAEAVAQRRDLHVVLSLAGRTRDPAGQAVPVRTGGFGGAEGLAAYLAAESVDLLIDATHPYAARISANAAAAAGMAGVPILALRRPGWERQAGDNWRLVGSVAAGVDALGATPRRVFLALGRQEVGAFATAPQHSYLIRSVDPVEPPLAVPDATYILARGPFDEAAETELLTRHRIGALVSKNSGGSATYAKIAAARRLGVEVIMIERPLLPEVPSGATVREILAMIDHRLGPAAKRGV